MSELQTIRLAPRGSYPLEVSRRLLVHDFGLHTHEHMELFVVLKGSAVHTVDKHRYFIRAGDVYVLGPGRTHSFTSVASLLHYNIGFVPSLLKALGEEISRIEGFQRLFVLSPQDGAYLAKFQLGAADLRRVEGMVEAIRGEYDGRGAGYEVVARSRFLELVVLLSRRYTAEPGSDADGLERLSRAAAHIEAHYRERIGVPQLAAICRLSPSHFSRLFRTHYSTSPAAYMQSLRLQHASFLLSDTSAAIGRIALECGFPDANFFARQFRLRVGVTPREYRRRSSGDRHGLAERVEVV